MYLYCDLHVHIGRSSDGRAVKITAARDLTFENIAIECAQHKGIDVVGVVDCASPPVIDDIEGLVESGQMQPLDGGGLRFRDQVTMIPAAEFETRQEPGGMSHHVSYFPDLEGLKLFSETMGRFVTNRELSSQACGLPAKTLFAICDDCGGTFVPAHCFTPHKSLYGACTWRAQEVFGEAWERIPAIELGLSADTYLADRIHELRRHTFLSNSDAHSLPKIGREYNILRTEGESYEEFVKALRRENGRRVVANFGLDPRLGKYHRTYCEECEWIARGEPPVLRCEQCGGDAVVKGVLDRIVEIADRDEPQSPEHRGHYQYQVPLQFVPGVGAVTIKKLINRFGSEMAVLHQTGEGELARVIGARKAHLIALAREGELPLQAGGGGQYGKPVPVDPGKVQLPGFEA